MTTKKKVLGVDPLSWITEKEKNKSIRIEDIVGGKEKRYTPKYETYDVKLTIRLNEKQLNFLTSLEREIMKNRTSKNKKERITKNSIIRSLLNVFEENGSEFNNSEIPDEKELEKRIFKNLKF